MPEDMNAKDLLAAGRYRELNYLINAMISTIAAYPAIARMTQEEDIVNAIIADFNMANKEDDIVVLLASRIKEHIRALIKHDSTFTVYHVFNVRTRMLEEIVTVKGKTFVQVELFIYQCLVYYIQEKFGNNEPATEAQRDTGEDTKEEEAQE